MQGKKSVKNTVKKAQEQASNSQKDNIWKETHQYMALLHFFLCPVFGQVTI
jgi:hypothetical protein